MTDRHETLLTLSQAVGGRGMEHVAMLKNFLAAWHRRRGEPLISSTLPGWRNMHTCIHTH